MAGDRKTGCISTNAKGVGLSLSRDRPEYVGLGRGLAWKFNNQELVKKGTGRGRASTSLKNCSTLNNVPVMFDASLQNPDGDSWYEMHHGHNLVNLTTETKNAMSTEPRTKIPKEHQLLLALSERVLRSFQNIKTTNVSKLSKELNTDEHAINMIIFMLYTHQIIEYNNKSNSWSLKTDGPNCEGLLEMLEMNKLNFSNLCTSFQKDCHVESNNTPIEATFATSNKDANCIDEQKTVSPNISEYIPPSLNPVNNDLSICHVSPIAFKAVAPLAAPVDDNLLNICRVAGLSGQDLTALQKGPLSAFNEYGQKNRVRTKVEIVEQTGGSHNPRFHAVASVNDAKLGDAWENTKKDAMREAARKALTTIISSKLVDGKSVHDDTVKALHSIFNNKY